MKPRIRMAILHAVLAAPLRLLRIATDASAATRRVWQVLLGLEALVITWLALVPAPPVQITTGWDKSNHALAFATLAFSSVWALARRPQLPQQWPALALGLLAYGGAIEIAQTYLPPREGDWMDLLADGVGISLGLAAASVCASVCASLRASLRAPIPAHPVAKSGHER